MIFKNVDIFWKDISNGTYEFVKEDGRWSARRAHSLMAASKVYTHENVEELVRIIEEENS